ncbi:flavin-containing monooxygenase [Novosphingobium bradum]|uniref:Flavin-containing monooxygenase n=1 Tax=Novosphingobium bradum TaxID=1737444 RepID=A0ABV7IPZ4_9SPHN
MAGGEAPELRDVLIVGAGFGGIHALARLRDGLGLDALLLDAGAGPGGTWYWNRYPGARCDVESLQYSFSFSDALQQEFDWTERFAAQPEILRYAEFVVDRLDLARSMRFDTRVASAVWDEDAACWTLTASDGRAWRARWVIMATGPLFATHLPDFPGLKDFAGEVYHTGAWPHEPVSFAGKRVAVLGTGSSGVQVSAALAGEAEQLYVLQRTPAHIVPAGNRPLGAAERAEVRARHGELRAQWNAQPGAVMYASLPPAEPVLPANPVSALAVTPEERKAVFERAWAYGGYALHRAFTDLLTDERSSMLATEFLRGKVAEIVKDPATAEALAPRTLYGTKRLILATGFYEMFNQPNVALVDLYRHPLKRFTKAGFETENGHYAVDAVVFATGFDALTGSLTRIDIRGRGGRSLKDEWARGPHTYLGMMTAGFPNLFMVGGPQSCSALANVITANEQQVEWFAECIAEMERRGVTTMEPGEAAQAEWGRLIDELAGPSMVAKGDNWYLGANIPGKARAILLFVGGFPAYKAHCDAEAARGYRSFALA